MTQVKSLEINKREILFKYINGQWWIALKPICEALGVNYDRALQNVKSDEILFQLYAKQHMVGADFKNREMVSLPERYIYGWIFSLQSKSEVLIAYKKQCYDILYDYFHNKLVERAASLKEKTSFCHSAEGVPASCVWSAVISCVSTNSSANSFAVFTSGSIFSQGVADTICTYFCKSSIDSIIVLGIDWGEVARWILRHGGLLLGIGVLEIRPR